MENQLPDNSKKTLLPVLIGAAAASAIAFFLYSDETDKLRAQLSQTLHKKWNDLKEKIVDKADAG